MRKGQFIFNFLRDYMGKGTMDNPYPNCHWVLFNISDENWKIMEEEYAKFKIGALGYRFPKKPFGKSIISKEHQIAFNDSIKDLLKKRRIGQSP